jgi:hypothetical protein
MTNNLKEILNDINLHKRNEISHSDPYPLYVVLKCLTGLDTLLLVNELNIRKNIDNEQAHTFLVGCIPKRKRYNKWLNKKGKNEDIELIMKYYNYSRTKATSVIDMFNESQLTSIKLAFKYDE